MTLWSAWWVWIAFALILAILETLLPVFAFAGMTAGAAAIGIMLALGITFGNSFGWALATFGAISLVATPSRSPPPEKPTVANHVRQN